jgi:Nicotinate-nucleotide pyrophosphorylase
MNWLTVDNFLKEALKEDSQYGDITTEAIISYDSRCSVELISKEEGIIAGLKIF